MDAHTFDRMIQSLATATSRRRVLKGLGASAMGALLLGGARKAARANPPCVAIHRSACEGAGGVYAQDGPTKTCTFTATSSGPGCNNPHFTVTRQTTTVTTFDDAQCLTSEPSTEIVACASPGGQPVTNPQHCC